jgi:signal peptidase I
MRLPSTEQPSPTRAGKRWRHPIIEWGLVVAVALGLAFGIQAFLVKTYTIPSGSMEPTLKIGQHILVNRIGMAIDEPYVGEIVVFHPPQGAKQELCGPQPHRVRFGSSVCSTSLPRAGNEYFVKRIVAGPGDEIYVSAGHVFRRAAGELSFARERDPYIKTCARPGEITVHRRPPLAPEPICL